MPTNPTTPDTAAQNAAKEIDELWNRWIRDHNTVADSTTIAAIILRHTQPQQQAVELPATPLPDVREAVLKAYQSWWNNSDNDSIVDSITAALTPLLAAKEELPGDTYEDIDGALEEAGCLRVKAGITYARSAQIEALREARDFAKGEVVVKGAACATLREQRDESRADADALRKENEQLKTAFDELRLRSGQ